MTVRALRSTAQRIRLLSAEAAGLRSELERLVAAVAPWLLELPGMGPISAAQVLVSWSHAGRLRSEAAFAALAGVSPIPASSGQITRHRLNRSGDRQLNRALHTIALARLRDDPDTRAYATRRRGEGKSARDIRRCVKRAIARQLFKLLERYDRPGVELLKTERSLRRRRDRSAGGFCTWTDVCSQRGHGPPCDGPGRVRDRAGACPGMAGRLPRPDAGRLPGRPSTGGASCQLGA